MAKRHSAVCYVFRDGEFSPVEDAKPFPNGLGLDLFIYKNQFYTRRICFLPCGRSWPKRPMSQYALCAVGGTIIPISGWRFPRRYLSGF